MTDPQQPSGWSEPTWQQPGSPPSPPPAQPPSYDPTAYGVPGYGQPGEPPPAYGQPQPAYGQPVYGQPVYVNPNPTNAMAIAALVCSLAGLLTIISAPVGAILGHVARKQIRERGGQGDGMALAGIIVGWVLTGLWVCGCGAYIAFIAAIIGGGAAAGTS